MKKEPARLEDLLAKFMLWGVFLPAAILLLGGAWFLYHHWNDPVRGHVFHSEPTNLRHPLDIVESAFSGGNLAFLQFGVLLLLLNPILRILLALIGYIRAGNKTYIAVCALLVLILGYSLLG